jgi:hypothetical protein
MARCADARRPSGDILAALAFAPFYSTQPAPLNSSGVLSLFLGRGITVRLLPRRNVCDRLGQLVGVAGGRLGCFSVISMHPTDTGLVPAVGGGSHPALLPRPILGALLGSESLLKPNSALIRIADFDRIGSVSGLNDYVLRFAHIQNMRPESFACHPPPAATIKLTHYPRPTAPWVWQTWADG